MREGMAVPFSGILQKPQSAIKIASKKMCRSVYAHRTAGGVRFRVTISAPITLQIVQTMPCLVSQLPSIKSLQHGLPPSQTNGFGHTAAGAKTSDQYGLFAAKTGDSRTLLGLE